MDLISRRKLARPAAILLSLLLGAVPAVADVCQVVISNPAVYTAVLRVDTANESVRWLSGADGSASPDYWTQSEDVTMSILPSPAGADLPDDPAALRQYFIQPDWSSDTNDQLLLGYGPSNVDWDQGGHAVTATGFMLGESTLSRLRIPTSQTVISDIVYVQSVGQGVNELGQGWSVTVENCTVPVESGGEVLLDLSHDPNDDDDTAVRLKNLSPNPGTVSVEFVPGNPLQQGDTVQAGFQLVDGTLRIESDIPPGELRARYRVEYDVRAVRRAGVRENGLRLMRRDSQTGVWGRAIRARVNPGQARYLRREADWKLGHHGFSPVRRYAWAVVDVNSRYAVGGPIAAQLPLASWSLFALGGALLGATWWEAARRRR